MDSGEDYLGFAPDPTPITGGRTRPLPKLPHARVAELAQEGSVEQVYTAVSCCP